LRFSYIGPYVGSILQFRIVRFLIGGGSATVLNLLLAFIAVDLLGFRSTLQQNYVNFAAMETSLVYSFFVYRAFVWKDQTSSTRRILLRQLPLYHLSAGAAVLTRTILFPVLQVVGLHYLLNIIVGIMVGAGVNYTLTNRYVFKSLVNKNS
jgi:dolichol-phosphate mannosyltransferase